MDLYSLYTKEHIAQFLFPDVMINLVFRAKSGTQFAISNMFYLQDILKCQVGQLKFCDPKFVMSNKFVEGKIVDEILCV